MGTIPKRHSSDRLHTGPPPCSYPTDYPNSHSRRRRFGRDGFTKGVQVHPRDITDGEPLRKSGPPETVPKRSSRGLGFRCSSSGRFKILQRKP